MAPTARAILFDLQGTCTDFFTSVVAAARAIDGGEHPDLDWGPFVSDWRKAYMRALGNDATAKAGAAPAWRSVREVYRQALEALLAERGLDGFDEDQLVGLVLAWEEQEPWPDVVPGLARLRARHTLGALSNADVPAVARTAKAGALPFDVLFSAQMFQAFKPDPAVYLTSARWLSLDPPDIMLVACHAYDVAAAHRLGFQTAFVPRPDELGPGAGAEPAPESALLARDFLDLADQLGS
ncbi:haloacid dehalogenase type II [Segniliparus rugosus]|uniref:Haloacid dehalogenase, type II n=1 Tax=Segniliparus rugosus (strain ATCC BAA-974 / DSM 45345 / CCUG 50838 / CIP 108380 / JCM 13579 / CDC 945) TaxID=679197 RepID=E5XTI0_SEGRC|nr:haloacid dehalogenase type II [Segniliparus rugosus]EFV12340.1 haloacid dehalogenase, type II [Segniliparus rugosus ATCC BAA-974]